jgi:hypothetical protein
VIPVNNANTNGVTGLCLEIHDLAISKYVAGREKDRAFTRELAKRRLTDQPILLARLESTAIAKDLQAVVTARIARDFANR